MATLKFEWIAGALIRGRILRGIKFFLDGEGIEYKVHESGGWFETRYRVVMTGPAKVLVSAYKAIQAELQSFLADEQQ